MGIPVITIRAGIIETKIGGDDDVSVRFEDNFNWVQITI